MALFKYSIYNLTIKSTKKFVLIFNSSSGSFCKINKDLFEEIYNNNKISSNIIHFDNLFNQRIIVNADLDEYNKIVLNETKSLITDFPLEITDVLALTLKCNMNCVYCFESKENVNKKCISEDIIYSIINFMKKQISVSSIKKFTIVWFGGEPLLEYDNILKIGKEIKSFCIEKKVTFVSSMKTNGLLLEREKTKQLVEECNLKTVQITLDGTKEVYCLLKQVSKNAFDKVIENIISVCDLVKITIRMNTNFYNLENIKELVDLLFTKYNLLDKIEIYLAEVKCYNGEPSKSFDFEKVKLQFYFDLEKKYGKNFSNLITVMKPKVTSCGLIKNFNSVIGPDGEIYKCDLTIGRKDFVVGNVADGYFFNDVYRKFNSPNHKLKCKGCKIFPLCLSGCRYEQLLFGNKSVDCKGKLKSLKKMLLNKYYKDLSMKTIKEEKNGNID